MRQALFMQYHRPIRIGTRKSPLALAQAELVRSRLMDAHPGLAVDLVPMLTSGDTNTDKSLADIGGKGLFTKELEEGLLSGSLDMAVHSLKDMETHLRAGMIIAATLEREDPRDALVSNAGHLLKDLPYNAKIGTSSVRRAAQLKIIRPDLEIVAFRGNVTTRLNKLKAGMVDATLLALAGLNRIGLENEATEILDVEHFIPAAGQGTLAVECLQSNEMIRQLLTAIHHAPTYNASIVERSLLATLDGSCRTPIAAYARLEHGMLRLDAMIAKADGSFHLQTSRSGNPADAEAMGHDAGAELLARGGRTCLG